MENKEFPGENNCIGCGVPEQFHNTVCGWHNASFPIFPWEKTINAAMSGEEKKERWAAIKEYFAKLKPLPPAEFIICAANWYDDGVTRIHQPKNIITGFVITGRRHHNCIRVFAQIVGFPYSPEAKKIHNTEIQGFLTNSDRFVGRKEAYKIAFEANQIIGPNKGYSENSIGLTSEDLY